jgi:hypothetical protein
LSREGGFCEFPLTGSVPVNLEQAQANPKGSQPIEEPTAETEIARENRAAQRETNTNQNAPAIMSLIFLLLLVDMF